MPCLDCGTPSRRSRCPEHERARRLADPYQQRAWRLLAKACIQRDKRCLICESGARLTANHIIARAHGGPDHLSNLMTMCGSCHSRYEAHVRHARDTAHRRRVDAVRLQLARQRGLALVA